jgi:signal recognition particle subunit SRP54
MFENLTEKFDRTFKRLKGQGKLSEKHLKEALREVRLALLEADVKRSGKALLRASR